MGTNYDSMNGMHEVMKENVAAQGQRLLQDD